MKSQVNILSLQNFQLDLQIIHDLNLEKEYFAREMGRPLAIMHWKCKVSSPKIWNVSPVPELVDIPAFLRIPGSILVTMLTIIADTSVMQTM